MVEHLLLIGDPTDIIVEADIGRPGTATRNIGAPAATVTLPPKPGLPVQPQPILASPLGSTTPRLLRERSSGTGGRNIALRRSRD